MAETAYSTEVNYELSAKEAQDLRKKSKLISSKNFRCPECGVGLTCTNWDREGTHNYFRISDNSQYHESDCMYASTQELKEAEAYDYKISKKEIIKSGKIVMLEESQTTERKSESSNEVSLNQKNKTTRNRGNKSDRNENTRRYSLRIFVGLYNDSDVDNNKIIEVKGKDITLVDLFVDTTSGKIVRGETRIYYGTAHITKSKRNVGQIVIKFSDGKYPDIYTNFGALSKQHKNINLDKYVDSTKEIIVYVRGSVNASGDRIDRYSNYIYKDIFLKEI